MAVDQPFLGLSLAPRLVTVAQSFPNGSAEVIAQVEGIEAYQETFAAMASKQSLNPTAFNQALQKSLKLVQSATNTHFNRRVEIPVVSLPSTVHDHSIIPTIKDAMTSIGFSSQHHDIQLQTIEISLAAHYAYGLGSANGLGLEAMDVDWDMGSYEALLVDYTLAGFSLSLIDLAQHGCVVRRQVDYPELGEDVVILQEAGMVSLCTHICNTYHSPAAKDNRLFSMQSLIAFILT